MDFKDTLVIGIASRALFDLEEENRIYEEEGLDAYRKYQIAHEKDILKPGAGFKLAKAFLKINDNTDAPKTEIIIMSRNSADTSLRIFNSVEHYKLGITRAALAGGSCISSYLDAFDTDLFLSANELDVQMAVNSGVAAGIICTNLEYDNDPSAELDKIRIAFDGDAVIFSDEAEAIFKNDGLEAFKKHEQENALKELPKGPFAKFLKTLSDLQKEFPVESVPIRTALVTARSAPTHERVIKTLEAWDVRIDEAFFLGGMDKTQVLKAFGAHIFFDDQDIHVEKAAKVVPSARVPYSKESPLIQRREEI